MSLFRISKIFIPGMIIILVCCAACGGDADDPSAQDAQEVAERLDRYEVDADLAPVESEMEVQGAPSVSVDPASACDADDVECPADDRDDADGVKTIDVTPS